MTMFPHLSRISWWLLQNLWKFHPTTKKWLVNTPEEEVQHWFQWQVKVGLLCLHHHNMLTQQQDCLSKSLCLFREHSLWRLYWFYSWTSCILFSYLRRKNTIFLEVAKRQTTIAQKPAPSFRVVYKKHTLTLDDLSTLADQNWLNDQVVVSCEVHMQISEGWKDLCDEQKSACFC